MGVNNMTILSVSKEEMQRRLYNSRIHTGFDRVEGSADDDSKASAISTKLDDLLDAKLSASTNAIDLAELGADL